MKNSRKQMRVTIPADQVAAFKRQDFSSGRCEIYMLESSEMEQIRGAEVLF
jgi:hypothetical protein